MPLRLYAEGLLSKWGFGDGDVLQDYLGDELDIYSDDIEDHDALAELIATSLIPVLNRAVVTERIHTIHNPVRARMIDGEAWYEDNPDPGLTPEFVEIPDAMVLDVIARHGYKTEAA